MVSIKGALRLGTPILFLAIPAAAVAAGTEKSPEPKGAEASGIEPHAARVVREMGSYLTSLQSFRVQSDAFDEVVLTNGSKVELATSSEVSVRRPNAIASQQVGPSAKMAAWYDGKSLSVLCKTTDTYGTVAAPPTMDGALDMARKQYGIEAPASDLVYSYPYAVLTEGAKSGQYLGIENIDGTPTHHVAFQEADVDWQLWIAVGSKPLPLRYVITTKTLPSQPEFTAHLKNRDTKASIPQAAFDFRSAAGFEESRYAAVILSCRQHEVRG